MTEESKYRMTLALTLVNKLYEVFQMLANEETDGRFNGYLTQTYGLKQDVEDKLREDFVDGPIQIASAPNLPNQTTQNTGGATVPNTGTNSNVTPQNPSGVPVSTSVQNPTSGSSQAGNQPTQNDIANFFSNVLAGKATNNNDLNDLLNQMTGQAQVQVDTSGSMSNSAPF